MFGLIDCNNFFVSCERIFRPDLEGIPVVVMSNNDGCAVAMSNEAKALGITRGKPIFEVREILRRYNVVTLSGNHCRYGDISSRVIAAVESLVGNVEVYSIDEAFINFPPGSKSEYEDLARQIVRRVRRWTGIPTSLGIAPTRTLAKVAARFAKKYPGYRSVCVIDNEEKRLKALELTDIGDVWGIGRRLRDKLRGSGIVKASDFAALPPERVSHMLNIIGQRTWKELNGIACIDADPESGAVRQEISTTRTFSPSLTDLVQIEQAVAAFTHIAARKLRRQGSCAGGISVFLQTNQFRTELAQYNNSAYRHLTEPTSDSIMLVKEAVSALRTIYKKGLLYRRAGVHITDIVPATGVQLSLFGSPIERKQRSELMRILDCVGNNIHIGNYSRTKQDDGVHTSSIKLFI